MDGVEEVDDRRRIRDVEIGRTDQPRHQERGGRQFRGRDEAWGRDAGAGDLSSIISSRPLKPLAEGDELFGMRIIDTPGHTLGHISVFEPATSVLVAGDALRTSGGLDGSDPRYTADEAKANDSIRKLAAMDIKAILPGHGEPLTAGASQALRKLAESLPA